jgi:hypothetical protein
VLAHPAKNAGPFVLTFDFMARDETTYGEVVHHPLLTQEAFAALYGVTVEKVRVQAHPLAMAVKVSIPRPAVQGSVATATAGSMRRPSSKPTGRQPYVGGDQLP